ncbi:MAG: hemerythrin domain-containing protein [Acidobacteriota bacterium]|nr:hemerythrin domain-containing protein [Acidobacteriota bacterium]MDH3785412.1 hemerythrin domain-containing protein [Acidobacteriota bacterium]
MVDEQHPGAKKRGALDHTLDEHRECDRWVAKLEDCLDSHPDSSGQWVGRLLEHLPGLARTLREHFVTEEQGPLYADLPTRRPRIASRVEALKLEHPGMLVEIDQIIDATGGLREAELYELRELNARIQLFVARLRRHEAAENELIFEAYWDDIGVGD